MTFSLNQTPLKPGRIFLKNIFDHGAQYMTLRIKNIIPSQFYLVWEEFKSKVRLSSLSFCKFLMNHSVSSKL